VELNTELESATALIHAVDELASRGEECASKGELTALSAF
jgi:hypothetical protein